MAALAALPALAHDGHGLPGTHWHASDAWGWLLLAGVAALVLHWKRRK